MKKTINFYTESQNQTIIKELQNRGMMLNKKNQQIIEAELLEKIDKTCKKDL